VEGVVYEEMSPEESGLDWSVTSRVLSDAVLMRTLEVSQSGGEKHAVIARVEQGELQETWVSPESAVIRSYPFNAVRQAFDAYDISDGVCLLIVRDNRAVISLNSLRR
jgi:hypothetical protein